MTFCVFIEWKTGVPNKQAEFSYSYIPFATRGLVVLVFPFNKYLLKKLFSRNTFISQVLKKLVDKEALGKVFFE